MKSLKALISKKNIGYSNGVSEKQRFLHIDSGTVVSIEENEEITDYIFMKEKDCYMNDLTYDLKNDLFCDVSTGCGILISYSTMAADGYARWRFESFFNKYPYSAEDAWPAKIVEIRNIKVDTKKIITIEDLKKVFKKYNLSYL